MPDRPQTIREAEAWLEKNPSPHVTLAMVSPLLMRDLLALLTDAPAAQSVTLQQQVDEWHQQWERKQADWLKAEGRINELEQKVATRELHIRQLLDERAAPAARTEVTPPAERLREQINEAFVVTPESEGPSFYVTLVDAPRDELLCVAAFDTHEDAQSQRDLIVDSLTSALRAALREAETPQPVCNICGYIYNEPAAPSPEAETPARNPKDK